MSSVDSSSKPAARPTLLTESKILSLLRETREELSRWRGPRGKSGVNGSSEDASTGNPSETATAISRKKTTASRPQHARTRSRAHTGSSLSRANSRSTTLLSRARTRTSRAGTRTSRAGTRTSHAAARSRLGTSPPNPEEGTAVPQVKTSKPPKESLTRSHRKTAREPLISYDNIVAKWDRWSRVSRRKFLAQVVEEFGEVDIPPVAEAFGQKYSLLFVRLVSWLRLTYLSSYALSLQLQTLWIFLRSMQRQHLLSELVEAGGLASLVDILVSETVGDEEKKWALLLLNGIACGSRMLRELICEQHGSKGVSSVVKALCMSENEQTQVEATNLLRQLGTRNPRFALAVYEEVATVFKLSGVTAMSRRFACQVLHDLLVGQLTANRRFPPPPMGASGTAEDDSSSATGDGFQADDKGSKTTYRGNLELYRQLRLRGNRAREIRRRQRKATRRRRRQRLAEGEGDGKESTGGDLSTSSSAYHRRRKRHRKVRGRSRSVNKVLPRSALSDEVNAKNIPSTERKTGRKKAAEEEKGPLKVHHIVELGRGEGLPISISLSRSFRTQALSYDDPPTDDDGEFNLVVVEKKMRKLAKDLILTQLDDLHYLFGGGKVDFLGNWSHIDETSVFGADGEGKSQKDKPADSKSKDETSATDGVPPAAFAGEKPQPLFSEYLADKEQRVSRFRKAVDESGTVGKTDVLHDDPSTGEDSSSSDDYVLDEDEFEAYWDEAFDSDMYSDTGSEDEAGGETGMAATASARSRNPFSSGVRSVGSSRFQPDARFVIAACMLFRVNDVQLHHEASELLRLLALRFKLDEAVLMHLCKLLQSQQDTAIDASAVHHSFIKATDPKTSAIRLLADLASYSVDFSVRIVGKGVVTDLLQCLCDTLHFDMQQQSARCLYVLNQNVSMAAIVIEQLMGQVIYRKFVMDYGTLHHYLKGQHLTLFKSKLKHALRLRSAKQNVATVNYRARVQKSGAVKSSGDQALSAKVRQLVDPKKAASRPQSPKSKTPKQKDTKTSNKSSTLATPGDVSDEDTPVRSRSVQLGAKEAGAVNGTELRRKSIDEGELSQVTKDRLEWMSTAIGKRKKLPVRAAGILGGISLGIGAAIGQALQMVTVGFDMSRRSSRAPSRNETDGGETTALDDSNEESAANDDGKLPPVDPLLRDPALQAISGAYSSDGDSRHRSGSTERVPSSRRSSGHSLAAPMSRAGSPQTQPGGRLSRRGSFAAVQSVLDDELKNITSSSIFAANMGDSHTKLMTLGADSLDGDGDKYTVTRDSQILPGMSTWDESTDSGDETPTEVDEASTPASASEGGETEPNSETEASSDGSRSGTKQGRTKRSSLTAAALPWQSLSDIVAQSDGPSGKTAKKVSSGFSARDKFMKEMQDHSSQKRIQHPQAAKRVGTSLAAGGGGVGGETQLTQALLSVHNPSDLRVRTAMKANTFADLDGLEEREEGDEAKAERRRFQVYKSYVEEGLLSIGMKARGRSQAKPQQTQRRDYFSGKGGFGRSRGPERGSLGGRKPGSGAGGARFGIIVTDNVGITVDKRVGGMYHEPTEVMHDGSSAQELYSPLRMPEQSSSRLLFTQRMSTDHSNNSIPAVASSNSASSAEEKVREKASKIKDTAADQYLLERLQDMVDGLSTTTGVLHMHATNNRRYGRNDPLSTRMDRNNLREMLKANGWVGPESQFLEFADGSVVLSSRWNVKGKPVTPGMQVVKAMADEETRAEVRRRKAKESELRIAREVDLRQRRRKSTVFAGGEGKTRRRRGGVILGRTKGSLQATLASKTTKVADKKFRPGDHRDPKLMDVLNSMESQYDLTNLVKLAIYLGNDRKSNGIIDPRKWGKERQGRSHTRSISTKNNSNDASSWMDAR